LICMIAGIIFIDGLFFSSIKKCRVTELPYLFVTIDSDNEKERGITTVNDFQTSVLKERTLIFCTR
jgi:hypothetical protein